MIIRPFTVVSGMLFVLSGATMFVVKHQSQLLDAQLSETNQATQQDEQSIRVLEAQWALEADPSRLAELAAQFTGLQPMKPGQLVTMASLGSSLPAPGAKPPGDNPEDPVPALPQLAAAAPPASPVPPVQSASLAPAKPAGAAPVQMAAITPPAVPSFNAPAAATANADRVADTGSMLAPVIAPAAPRHHNAARVAMLPVHHGAPLRREMGSSVYLAAARSNTPTGRGMPMGAQLVPARAMAAAAPMPADDGGSLLGMAQDGSQ
jgi:hypothetical protein